MRLEYVVVWDLFHTHTGVLCATGWSPVDQALLECSNHGPQFHAGSGQLLFGSRQSLFQLQLCLWGTAEGRRGKRGEEREERKEREEREGKVGEI